MFRKYFNLNHSETKPEYIILIDQKLNVIFFQNYTVY